MKKIFLLLLLLFPFINLQAQTWTGATSTDWKEASNWLPAGVPGVTANILIPGTVASNNWPVFSGDVTINSIDMQPGCRLDVNGYPLTVTGVNMNNNFSGAEINNSNNAADIIINLNTGINGFITYFRSNTVNDNIIFNLTGSNQFIEAVAAPANVYNGDASFNINDILTVSISYGAPSQFNGNLSVNRAVAGVTSLFYAGAIIAGNFSYINNAGSPTVMGNPGIKTSIGGMINITVNDPAPAAFEMFRLTNQAAGGNINIINSLGFNVQLDTLLVNALNINGYRGNEYGKLLNNDITGDISIADDVSYAGGFYTYIRNNKITGNSIFSVNGSNTFFEADQAGSGNNFTGDVSFNSAGSAMYISYAAPLQCSGDLTINRTGAGLTSAFNAGAAIGGNFTYSNNTSGHTYLGNLNNKTSITGTININAFYSVAAVFEMIHVENKTYGGMISIQNSLGFNIQKDTLLLNALNISGYGGNEYGRLLNNDLKANITLLADAGYSSGFATYIRNNVITGNSQFTSNGSNAFLEADIAGSANKYMGNLEINAAGTGDVYLAYLDTIWCSGNISINRTSAGNIVAFNAGATIMGDFSFTNNTSGHSYFGNLDNRTTVNGTVNMNVVYTLPAIFRLYRIINLTTGGNIIVQNPMGFDLQRDSLRLGTLSISGYRGNEYGRLMNNDIHSNIILSADPGYSGGFATYIRSNTITGNSQFTSNGSNAFLEADIAGSANKYNGNLDIIAAGTGDLYIAFQDSLWCSGNVSIIRTAAGNTSAFNAGATINGNFSFTNNTAGNTSLGNLAYKTGILGTIDINAAYVTPGLFIMHRLFNLSGGGNVSIQQSQGFDIVNDSLLVGSLSVIGYRGSAYGRLLNNSITGNVTIEDDASFTAGFLTYIRNNVITGNSQFTNNSSNAMLDADIAESGNRYNGNLSYTRTNGSIITALNDSNEISGNLTLNSASNIGLGSWVFNGNTNGILEQLASQPVSMASLTMHKDAGATLTLNDPVTIINTVEFNGGNINSSPGNELIFADNSSHTGCTDASYVSGPVVKTGDDAFTFPVGKINKFAPISISAPALPTDEFRATYFWSIPHDNGFDSTQLDPSINHISDNEYWMLDRTAGASNVTVTLSWETARSGVIDNMVDLRVVRWNGSLWKDEGNGGTTGNNASGAIVTASAVSDFSPFTIASATTFNPIPVKLVSFSAVENNGKVLLQWITENDVNINRYEIERGADANWFMYLSGLPAKRSAAQVIYRSEDNFPYAGVNFYRLKMTGTDGHISYSNIIMVESGKKSNISIWPNPAKDNITITGGEEFLQIQLLDVTGKLVKQMDKSTDNRYSIKNLERGVYYVRLTNEYKSVMITLLIE